MCGSAGRYPKMEVLKMEKKEYISLEVEIVEFDNEDVITESNGTDQF